MLVWVWLDKDGKPLVHDNLDDPETAEWLKTATLQNQPYLAPAESPPRARSDFPGCPTDDLRDDVLACQALVEQHGMEMLLLDQTRPDIGLPVVKVIRWPDGSSSITRIQTPNPWVFRKKWLLGEDVE